jgi:hypothetical protein
VATVPASPHQRRAALDVAVTSLLAVVREALPDLRNEKDAAVLVTNGGLASENFGVRDGQGVRLTVPARHKDIAELVGASRPRVTEYLALFEREHLIVRDSLS